MNKIIIALLLLSLDSCADPVVETDVAASDYCPRIDPPPAPPGSLPGLFRWSGSWKCSSGCTLAPPLLTRATDVTISTDDTGTVAAWDLTTTPPSTVKIPVTESNTCWRMERYLDWPPLPAPSECRSAVDICGTYCTELTPPQDCVRATATWTDVNSGLQQTWTFRGVTS